MSRYASNPASKPITGFAMFIALVYSLFLLATIGGCSSTPDPATPAAVADTNPATVPEFTLKLRKSNRDNRFTNFEITSKGMLLYASGKTAMIGEVNPVRLLTPSERARILAIVDQYKLEEAPNSFFKTSRKTEYLFSFNRGLLGVTIRNVDDETPGFKELHDLLMDLQSQGR